MEISKRHLAKSITWRIIGSIDTILISFFLTGSLLTGAGIGLIELFSKTIIYYFHEILWFNSSFTKRKIRHILKTFSWRFVATLDTFLIAWLITGDSIIGIQIGLIETITKIILYFCHDKIWYRINYGLNRNI